MSHPLRLRILFFIGLPILLLVLCASFLVAPQRASAATTNNCGQSVNIISQTTGVVIGKVTKVCQGFSYASAYVESYLTPTTQMAAWVSNPNNTGTTTSTTGTVLSSHSSPGGMYYPACGVVSNGSVGGSACTP